MAKKRAETPTLSAAELRRLYARETPDVGAYYSRLHARCLRLLRDHYDYMNDEGIAMLKLCAYAAFLRSDLRSRRRVRTHRLDDVLRSVGAL
jgi:hypothetical protein